MMLITIRKSDGLNDINESLNIIPSIKNTEVTRMISKENGNPGRYKFSPDMLISLLMPLIQKLSMKIEPIVIEDIK